MVQIDATNLLRVRNWWETARYRAEWRERIGEAMARKRPEALDNDNDDDISFKTEWH